MLGSVMLRCIAWMLGVLLVGLCAAQEERVDYREIGRRVWVNESAARPHALVQWDEARECIVMGIGGCSWYAAGPAGRADEDFPKFVAFATAQGAMPPKEMHGIAPWAAATDLQTDKSGRKERMHKWLAEHLDVQARFLIARAHAALPAMLRQSSMPKQLSQRFEELALTQQGLFCLVDYMSMVGVDNPSAGLRQALEEMRPGNPAGSAHAEFAHAAAVALQKAAKAQPKEGALLPARLKRCRTYALAPKK